MIRFSEALARLIERRPWWFVIIAVVLVGAAVPGVTMLDSSTGFEALVSPGAKISQDNARYEEQFGAETIIVMLNGPVENILSGENLMALHGFEQEFSRDDRYRSITSPLTLLEIAIDEAEQVWQTLQEQIATAQEQAAAEARRLAAEMGLSEEQQELAAEQARAEVLKEFQPYIEQLQQVSLDNPLFVAAVLYDPEGAISQVMLPFVPDDEHVMMVITPQGNMSDDEALQVAQDIEDFFTANPLAQVDVTVIADSKLVTAISNSLGQNIAILFGLSVVAMVLILLLIFRVHWRLLSLLIVGIGTLWTFGLMGYASVPMTMTTMAVLPILIGLGIDYSIQFQNRYQEEVTRSRSVTVAIITSLSRMFPVVSIALLATLIGFITLYISEVPMIRDFGMMLAVGIVLCYIAGLFLLNSIVYLSDRRIPIERLSRTATKAGNRIERVLSRIARLAVKYPLPVFLVALVFAIAGGVVDQWLPTNTDYEQLMPQDIPELAQLRELRRISGSGGEIRFMVEADNVATPDVLNWLQGYQAEELAAYPELISANSPVTLISRVTDGVIPTEEEIAQILENAPTHYVEQVISSDRTMASLSFSTTYLSLEEIHDLLQSMTEDAHPPADVRVSPVGTLALGASTVDAVVGTRFTMNLLCLGAVFIVLLLVYRHLINAIFIILPAGAVIAWSSLDMYLIGIPLNPLTAVLGVLIIGICTEFMVLLMGRYGEEKREGELPQDAMVTALSKIGRAIVTTALTTLGGFGVLIASDFVMIRDFGIATVLGVFLCLVATITVMPGIIVWFDRWRMKRAANK